MRICVVSPDYPTSRSIDFIFVDQLCKVFADFGEQITVIAPQSITHCIFHNLPLAPFRSIVCTEAKNQIQLIRPKYISVGNISGILKDHNDKSFRRAIERGFNCLEISPDVVYCHFWQSAIGSFQYVKKKNIPLVVASGEEDVKRYVHLSPQKKEEISSYISTMVNVSKKNRDECLSLELISKEKTNIIPNAINTNLFHYRNRIEIRKELGYDEKDFIVIFVGQFVVRKGTLRLNDSLKKLADNEIKAIFVGSGDEVPNYQHIIYKGRIKHKDLPKYLSAADVFVLPTRNEGCCNAIVEALACGLPIISTDAPFNYDILDESNSILVDSENIQQISDAIKNLKNDVDLRNNLSNGALVKASSLCLDNRANKIINLIKGSINSY